LKSRSRCQTGARFSIAIAAIKQSIEERTVIPRRLPNLYVGRCDKETDGNGIIEHRYCAERRAESIAFYSGPQTFEHFLNYRAAGNYSEKFVLRNLGAPPGAK
jgi:hypothetical protein